MINKDKSETELDIFRDVINRSNDAIFLNDPQTGRFIFVNDKACASLGYDREELLKMGVMDIETTLPDNFSWLTHVNELRQRGSLMVEGIHKRRNGTTFPVEASISYAVLNTREYMVAVVRDITERKQVEEALRSAEQKYRSLIETTDTGFVIIDRTGRVMDANQKYAELCGRRDREDVIGHNVLEWTAPYDQERNVAEVRQCMAQGYVRNLEIDYLTPAGKTTPVEINATVLRSGDSCSILTLCRDITERKQSEAKLRVREKQLAESQRIAHIGSWEHNPTTGQVFWSDELFYLLGLDPKTDPADFKMFFNMVHPDDQPALRKAIDETVRLHIPSSIDYRFIFKDGTTRVIHAQAELIHDDTGTQTILSGTAQDITERKRAEEALKESENRFRLIAETITEVFWMADASIEQMFYISPAYERVWKRTRKGLYENPRSLIDAVHPEDRERVSAVIEVQRTGQPSDHEYRIVQPDGRLRWIWERGFPVRDESGRVTRYLGVAQDITERKMMEAEVLKKQKLESIGILAGGIAHDFNNLLQAMMGNISLAMMLTNPKENTFPLLEQAMKASEQAKGLSYRLLTFSRGGDPVRRIVSVKTLLQESISLSLSGSNVACELSLPEDLDLFEVDKGQMNQVFNNLLINAKEAMPGGGTVEISAANVRITGSDNLPLKEGHYVKISLADHGIGIPAKHLPRIFDPYFSTKDRGSEKGMGLGLAICHSIITKHEGHIAVESKDGGGTAFHIYLPASERKHEEQAGESSHYAAGKGRVLLMDDEEIVRKISGAILRQLGYEVEFARNGEEAVKAYGRSREAGRTFDAVILDLTVQGGMGGEKALSKLREIDPEVRAVVSSGYALDPVMKEFGKYGFVDAIAKPYDAEGLKKLLAQLQIDKR
jgi:PAS domain S-box-containing protein